jgi:hypothetical protein
MDSKHHSITAKWKAEKIQELCSWVFFLSDKEPFKTQSALNKYKWKNIVIFTQIMYNNTKEV